MRAAHQIEAQHDRSKHTEYDVGEEEDGGRREDLLPNAHNLLQDTAHLGNSWWCSYVYYSAQIETQISSSRITHFDFGVEFIVNDEVWFRILIIAVTANVIPYLIIYKL